MNQHTGALAGDQTRVVEERRFTTHDGIEIFYRAWPALAPKANGAIVLLHRGHEHSGRVAHLVPELDLPDYAFYAWDARGHGLTSGERGFSPSCAASVRDLDTFVRHIVEKDGIAIEDVALVGQSAGAVLAAAWVHDYAPKICAMVLASPAFSIKLYVPFARHGLKLLHALRGNFFVNSYVKPRFLTHDVSRISSYETDPLITRPISVNMLLDLYEASDRIVADARAITTPTQMLLSGADWVVRPGLQHDFFVNLGTAKKERHVLPGFFHDTLGERDRGPAVAKARAFLLARFAEPFERPSRLDAHRIGYTRDESDRLASPLSLFSPRGLYWAATRLWMRAGGWLSDGIKVGHKTGFDSGSMLDYVYRNQATGKGALGRVVDRGYLDSIGWRGIRQRKVNAEELINLAMGRLAAVGKPVHVMDIAAGHGRYVLEALSATGRLPDSILLRDYSDINVEAGRRLIGVRGLTDIAKFEKGDAFDPASLAAVEPKPTLAIVSGLYELFPDNDQLARSLGGLKAAVPVGGYLVYTGQPWHPQLELIARALTSHRQGQAWLMRRRTQDEMDQLVAAAGFRKIEQRIDDWGIFTVSLAERVEG